MTEMTVTEFSRNLRSVFDRIEHNAEEIILIRNNHKIARIIPGSPNLTALEAMDDKTFKEHVNEEKNELADWLKKVNKSKGEAISKVKTKQEMIDILKKE